MAEQFEAPFETETVKETQEELIKRLREEFPGVFQRVEDLRPEGCPIFVEEEKDEDSFEKYAEMTGGTWMTRVAPGGAGEIQYYENELYTLNEKGELVDRQDPGIVAVVEIGCRHYEYEGPATGNLDEWAIVTLHSQE